MLILKFCLLLMRKLQNGINRYGYQKIYLLTSFPYSAYISLPFLATIITLCLTSGFAMATYYQTCDPASAGLLDASDQLMGGFFMLITIIYSF